MKMDLYLQERVAPYNIVKIEGIEVIDELIGTWDNQRATIEIPAEIIEGWGLPYTLDYYKGIARLYNNKRVARRQFKFQQGWNYVYYLPQKLYKSGVETIKVPEFPFGYYAHGGLNLQNLNIIDRGLYDYIQQNNWVLEIEGYTKRPYSYIIVWRFYIPEDYPETSTTRIFGAWYSWNAIIRPDGVSTISWPYPAASFDTPIFIRGHSYMVVWTYANYEILQQDVIHILRDDGTFVIFSSPMHNPYSNDFLRVIFQNATFPLEDLIVFWDLENNLSAYITALNEIDDYALQYTTVELYNPTQHDEQVYFIEKITYEVEEGQQPKNLYTLELSDIAALETVVAPFSINYRETKIHDNDGFGRETYYILKSAITPSYSNYIRAFLYTIAMFEMLFDFDYDLVVIGSNTRGNEVYFISTLPYNLKTGLVGNTSVQLLYASPYFQIYIRIKSIYTGNNEIWIQYILLNQRGEIRTSRWYLFSNARGYPINIQFRKPVAVIDGTLHYVFIPMDLRGYDVWTEIERWHSFLWRIKVERDGNYTYGSFNIMYVNAQDTLGTRHQTGGASAVMVKRLATKWIVIWVIHELSPYYSGLFFVRYDNLDLLDPIVFVGTGSEVGDEMDWRFKNDIRNLENNYRFYNFDFWKSGSGEIYKGVIALPEVGAIVFTLNYDTSTITMDGFISQIWDVKFIGDVIGAVAILNGNVIFWRRDLPNINHRPQYYRLMAIDNAREICYVDYSDDSNRDYFQTIFIISDGDLFASPPRYNFSPLFISLPLEGEIVDNIFSKIAEVDVSIIENFHAYRFVSGRNHIPARIEFRTLSWSNPGRYRIGLPIKLTINLWGFSYNWIGYIYISEQAIPLISREWNANVKESIFKWDKFGQIQQGLYRITLIFDWQRAHIKHGYWRNVRVYDIKQEIKYLKYVIANRYIEGIIWDYLTDNDTFAIDDIETSQEIIQRLNDNNFKLQIVTIKTPDPVYVGDIITFNWNNINQGLWKVIKITRDNNYITTATAVKLPI